MCRVGQNHIYTVLAIPKNVLNMLLSARWARSWLTSTGCQVQTEEKTGDSVDSVTVS